MNVMTPLEERDQKRTKEALHCPGEHMSGRCLSFRFLNVNTVFDSFQNLLDAGGQMERAAHAAAPAA